MADCPQYNPGLATGQQLRDGLLATYSSTVVSDVDLDATSHIPTSELSSKYSQLRSSGYLSPDLPQGLITKVTIEDQIKKDRELMKTLHAEFCHYYPRWSFALDKFISYATSREQTDIQQANDLLVILKTLNIRCIYVIELMNYVTELRIPPAQRDAASIRALNSGLNPKLQRLQVANKLFQDKKATVITQREMVRYTETKNAANMRTVMFWAGANVMALGAIGAVYTML